jgi:2,4-dienoyl-CoA reductase-like NADH-dependent reductase (Old Yellow Enzyme family)
VAKTTNPSCASAPYRDWVERVTSQQVSNRALARGYPTDWHRMHLGRYVDGGAGLVFQEGTAVQRSGCGTLGDLGIWGEEFVEPLTRFTLVIRDNGAVPRIQLMHARRKARMSMSTPMEGHRPLEPSPNIPDWDEWEPAGPSVVPLREGAPPPRRTGPDPRPGGDHSDATRRRASAIRSLPGSHSRSRLGA